MRQAEICILANRMWNRSKVARVPGYANIPFDNPADPPTRRPADPPTRRPADPLGPVWNYGIAPGMRTG